MFYSPKYYFMFDMQASSGTKANIFVFNFLALGDFVKDKCA